MNVSKAMHMLERKYQKLVAIILIVTALPQCWPLLAKGICTMPAPQIRPVGASCCCCVNGIAGSSADTAACAPSKTLSGVLKTDDSIQSDSQHLKKRLTLLEHHLFEQLPLRQSAGIEAAPAVTVAAQSSPPGVPASLYLFDCSFRI